MSQEPSKMRRLAGFTSLEFTNGLSAAALLVTATLSGGFDFLADLDRCEVSNQLLTGLRVARTTAHQYGKPVTVCPSEDGKSCSPTGDWSSGWIAFLDMNRNGDLEHGEKRKIIARALNSSSDIAVITDWDRFSFAPGTPVAVAEGDAAATLCIRDARGPQHSRVIWIDARGRAELHTQRPPRELAENAARDFSHRSKDCY